MFMVHIYRNAFRYFAMGYASALSVVLFLAILVVTLLIFRSANAWVYYEGADRGWLNGGEAFGRMATELTSVATAAQARQSGGDVAAIVCPATPCLAIMAFAFMIPFYWMVTSALKNNTEIFARPIQWLPPAWRWENFPNAPELSWLSVLTFPVEQHLLFRVRDDWHGDVLCGCRLWFRTYALSGARPAYSCSPSSTMMIPSIVTFIPTFILFRSWVCSAPTRR